MAPTYLGNLAESPAFLAEVDDHTTAPILGFFHGFFDAEDQIWPACADIGAEDVATVTLGRVSNTGSSHTRLDFCDQPRREYGVQVLSLGPTSLPDHQNSTRSILLR